MGSVFSSGPQQNIENIADQTVYSVFCNSCKIIISQRGCRVNLASNLNIPAYSTDVAPESVEELKEYHKYKSCSCLYTKAICKKCRSQCACRVIYCCQFCQDQVTNGHIWIFLDTFASANNTRWSQLQDLPKAKVKFDELLKIIGITDATMEILFREEINSARQLPFITDEMLKAAGISLGQIALLRQLK